MSLHSKQFASNEFENINELQGELFTVYFWLPCRSLSISLTQEVQRVASAVDGQRPFWNVSGAYSVACFCSILVCTSLMNFIIIPNFLAMDNANAAVSMLKLRLHKANNNQLLKLCSSTDRMIAIFAKWELSKDTEGGINDFVSDVKKKFEIDVPPWWVELLRGFQKSDLKLARKLLGGKCDLEVNWNGLRVNAEPDGVGCYYGILAHDGASREVWSSISWANGLSGTTGIHIGHRVSMRADKDRLIVFGSSASAAYFEVYSLKDGTPTFRFCTSYWHNEKDYWAIEDARARGLPVKRKP